MFPIPFLNLLKHLALTQKGKGQEAELLTIAKTRNQLIKMKNFKPGDQYLKKMKFFVFDTETTGFHPYGGDEIISIGAVAIEHGQIKDEQSFHSYINPGRKIPEKITQLTGITQSDVSKAPNFLTVFSTFLDFIQDGPLIAHCADFDFNFINAKLKKHGGVKMNYQSIDTMNLASHLQREDDPPTLDHLIQFYGIPMGFRHHALEDARMTAQLFLHQLEELEKQGVYTLYELKRFIQYKNDLRQMAQACFVSF